MNLLHYKKYIEGYIRLSKIILLFYKAYCKPSGLWSIYLQNDLPVFFPTSNKVIHKI